MSDPSAAMLRFREVDRRLLKLIDANEDDSSEGDALRDEMERLLLPMTQAEYEEARAWARKTGEESLARIGAQK